MGQFILRRLGVMILTALCLTFIVFFLTNLYPNLEKLAKTQGNMRMSDEAVASWLEKRGYLEPVPVKYAQWLGVLPSQVYQDGDNFYGRCLEPGMDPADAPRFCGLLQGDWGSSTVFKADVGGIIATRLGLTGKLMFWVMVLMVPSALIIGVLAGMREGTATSAADDADFWNFFLPVLTIALYGMGYIARMTRASMTEVMTAQYIRTARLKGVSFRNIVLKHALRNALIAPFTVIMLQFPWLLNGVVIVETLFNYKGFGWTLVQAAGNNDIELLLACSVAAVFVVLVTQLISDIGYVFLNPRIRIA